MSESNSAPERYLVGKLKQISLDQESDPFHEQLDRATGNALGLMVLKGFWPSTARSIVARHRKAKITDYIKHNTKFS